MIDRRASRHLQDMRSLHGISLALSLALVIPALACVVSGDDVADTDNDTGDTGDTDSESDTGDTGEEGECVEVTALGPVIGVSVDGATTMPNLSTDCTVLTAAVAAGNLSLSLSCTNADPMAMDHIVEIDAPAVADEPPAGLEVDASVSLETSADESSSFGPGPRIVLSDGEGPLLAQVPYTPEGPTWGPIELSYDSYCPVGGDALGETGSGFVRAAVTGSDDDYEVFVGAPQIIGDGVHEWELHALDATDVCCHGPSIGAALIRQ